MEVQSFQYVIFSCRAIQRMNEKIKGASFGKLFEMCSAIPASVLRNSTYVVYLSINSSSRLKSLR